MHTHIPTTMQAMLSVTDGDGVTDEALQAELEEMAVSTPPLLLSLFLFL
jgi:hypothetical protein